MIINKGDHLAAWWKLDQHFILFISLASDFNKNEMLYNEIINSIDHEIYAAWAHQRLATGATRYQPLQ